MALAASTTTLKGVARALPLSKRGFFTFSSRVFGDFILTVFWVKDKVLVSEANGYSELGGGNAGKAVRVVRLFVIDHRWKFPKCAPAGANDG